MDTSTVATLPEKSVIIETSSNSFPSVRVVKKRQWQYSIHHAIVFVVTFVSYMLFHANRKTFSNLKSSMINNWIPVNDTSSTLNGDYDVWNSHNLFATRSQAEKFAGSLDAVFMFTYAVGLYVSGILGDRFDPRVVLSVGMMLSSVINLIFGSITEWCHFYSIPLYVVLWILNGFAQSTGWPTVVSVMGNWFGRGSRGFILGLWSSCASVGNIVGSYLCAGFLPYGYEYAFLVNASLLFAGSIMAYFSLVRAPRELGLIEPTESENDTVEPLSPKEEKPIAVNEKNAKPKTIGFIRAVLIPGVILYSFAYAGLKLVNYAIFFWLPYYMNVNFGWSEAVSAEVSTYYDWGGIIGSVVGGIASDLIGKRSPIVFVQLIFSILFLGIYTQSPNNQAINGLLMGIAGFFVNGAVNLISAAVAADLGRQEAVKQSAEALSTVSGIVEGTGSVGAAVGQVIIPPLEEWLGWNSTFYMFMILLASSTIILLRLAFRETREVITSLKAKLTQMSSGVGSRIMIYVIDPDIDGVVVVTQEKSAL